jgi:hypothetical protein
MLIGNWDRVMLKIKRLSDDLKAEIGLSTAQSLQRIEKRAVGHINKQDLKWAPLSPAYKRYKERTRDAGWRRRRKKAGKTMPRRLSEKILIATGEYRKAITSHQLDPFSGEVGVSRQEKYNGPGGAEIADIGIMLEEGTSQMEARPLWEPTADEMQEEVSKRFIRAVEKALDV